MQATDQDRADLDRALIRAHEVADKEALVSLYSTAADRANDVSAAAFYLTHAFVFALEIGHPTAEALKARLVAQGRH